MQLMTFRLGQMSGVTFDLAEMRPSRLGEDDLLRFSFFSVDGAKAGSLCVLLLFLALHNSDCKMERKIKVQKEGEKEKM